MSTNVTHLADNILPVTRGQGLTLDLSAGAEVIVDLRSAAALPPNSNTDAEKSYWSAMYATLQADGGDLYFYFTDDGAAGLVNAPAGGFWGARNGAKILNGQSVDQLLPVAPSLSSQGGSGTPPVWKRRFIHAIKAAGAGATFLSMWPSSTRILLCAVSSVARGFPAARPGLRGQRGQRGLPAPRGQRGR